MGDAATIRAMNRWWHHVQHERGRGQGASGLLRMVWRWWCWCLCALGLSGALTVHAAHHAHHAEGPHAQAASSPPVPLNLSGVTVLDEACVIVGAGIRPPDDEAAWLHTTLPHLWSSTHPGYQGTMWYRFRVRLAAVPADTWAVYLPRAVMNAQVWVNGSAVAYTGSMSDPVTRHWYTPLLVNVPSSAWTVGENIIYVRVVSGQLRRHGLAPIQAGPAEQLVARQQQRSWMQADGVLVANIALLALGVLMAIIWLRDRDQVAVGYISAAALMWSVGTSVMVAPNPISPVLLWENLAFFITAWGLLMICLYYYRHGGGRVIWPERLAQLMIVVVPAAALISPTTRTQVLVYCAIYALAMGGFLRAAMTIARQRHPEGLWLLLGIALMTLAASHDLLIELGWSQFDAVYLLPFVAPLNVCLIFISLAGEFSRSRRALRDLNRTLSARVAQREHELRDSFARLAAMERAQAVSAERSRILKDMHDGVGAHLSSALRQLQAPAGQAVDLPMVTQTLRDSLDQLKLSIDAMQLQPGDVVGLLASLRFRMTPRLKAAGIDLVWDVPEMPSWPMGTPPALRQLQYILFEALSNALQHAGATRLVLMARQTEGRLTLSLIDNGVGMPPGSEQGQGLQGMVGRAAVIGGQLEFVRPTQGGLEVRLTLPWQASDWSGLSSAA